MKLVVHELITTLSQQVTATKNFNLSNIRPHIYKHGSPSGSLQILIEDINNKLVASSNIIAISSLSTLAYAHKYYKFDVITPIKLGGIYKITLKGISYTFSESAYIGWCLDYDLRKYTATYSPNAGIKSAFDFEGWEEKEL